MTYVRQNLAKLSTTDISKLSGMNEYKHQVLQAISDLYSDLEARRKPMIIELNAGKALDIMLSPTTLLIPKEGEKLLLLHPISFAIPEENIISINPPKNKTFGAVIPGKTSTYFTSRDEATYFADMEKSLYVLTFKKGGWDCHRHYEILAAGALPLFLHIKHCPQQALVAHPKKLYQLILKQPGLEVSGSRSGLHTMEIEKMHLNYEKFSPELYRVVVSSLLQYTRNVLSTKAMASYVLDTMVTYSQGKLAPPHSLSSTSPAGEGIEGTGRGREGRFILYLTHEDHDMDKGDYLTDFILMGLKNLLGAEAVVDFPCRDAIYQTNNEFNLTKYWQRRDQLYGGGVSWGLKEDVLYDTSSRDRGTVTDNIISRTYDMVILGSGHRDGWAAKLHFWDLICKHYNPLEVGYIDGSDRQLSKKLVDKYAPCAGHLFSREGFETK